MPPVEAVPPPTKARADTNVLLLIAVFKLVKGIALLALGFGALHLLHRDLEQTVAHWIEVLRVDPHNRFIHRLLSRILGVSPRQLRELSVGTFLYAGLFLTEGTGLLLRKRWAEYFTIITTGSLLPLEIYEVVERFDATRILVLFANAAIVVYLVLRVRRSGTRS